MCSSQWKLQFMVPTAAVFLLLSAERLHAQEGDSSGSATSGAEEATQPQATVEEEIVVSANRIELPARNVGSSVTVIRREEIERRHKTTVLELLRTVPGLEVAQTGGPGKTTSVFIRGSNSSHTLVLLDGVRVNNNTGGNFDFPDLTTDNIERIEVLRGPQGSLYGSEAVAGVVSITTRRGEGSPSFWLGGELGDENHSHLSAGVSGGNEKWDYSLGVAKVSTDGISAASEKAGNTEDDPWENLTLSARFGIAFLDDGRVDFAMRYVDSVNDVDGGTFGGGPADDLNARQKREAFTSALTVTKALTSWWSQTFFLGASQDDLVGEDPDTFFSNFEITSETAEFFLQSDVLLSQNDTLVFGYRVERREAENVGSFDDSLYLRSFFLQNLWSWQDRYHFTVSVRNDDHSKSGDETTYRFTASLLFGERTRFHGSYGTGFKAPTFDELFFLGFGNPNLLPETNEGFDLGIEEGFLDGRLVLDLTYFGTEFEDLIQFTFPAGFVNVADATSDGAELTVRWEPTEKLLLQASHTWIDTEDLSTGRQLARRPENRSTLYVAFQPLERLRGTASLVVVSDRIESDGSRMDDYERVDFTLDYRTSPWLRPYLRVENLFDEDYAEVPGFTSPGLTAAVGLHVGR